MKIETDIMSSSKNTEILAQEIASGDSIAMQGFRGERHKLYLMDDCVKIFRGNKDVSSFYPQIIYTAEYILRAGDIPNNTIMLGIIGFKDNRLVGPLEISRSRKPVRALEKQRKFGLASFFGFDFIKFSGAITSTISYKQRFLIPIKNIKWPEYVSVSNIAGFSIKEVEEDAKRRRINFANIMSLKEIFFPGAHLRYILPCRPELCWLEKNGDKISAYQLDEDNTPIKRIHCCNLGKQSIFQKINWDREKVSAIVHFDFIDNDNTFYNPWAFSFFSKEPMFTDCRPGRFSS